MKEYSIEEKEQIVKNMLIAIGEDPEREGLKDTPKRVVKMWKEIFRGYDKEQTPKITTFNNGSDGIVYNQVLTDTGDFYSHCEHHGVTFSGHYFFAYLPNTKGSLIGLSKIARVVDYFSAKLQIQERLTHQVIEYLWKILCNSDCDNPPIGMGLVMEAEHLCKTMRGVKKKGMMRTTVLRGSFLDNEKTRDEFLNWVNSYRRDK